MQKVRIFARPQMMVHDLDHSYQILVVSKSSSDGMGIELKTHRVKSLEPNHCSIEAPEVAILWKRLEK